MLRVLRAQMNEADHLLHRTQLEHLQELQRLRLQRGTATKCVQTHYRYGRDKVVQTRPLLLAPATLAPPPQSTQTTQRDSQTPGGHVCCLD